MLDAVEVPFDASKLAFRTNFDGLSTSNPALQLQLENVTKSYQSALTNFASEDKNAREDYQDQKDNGLTDASFGTWVKQGDCPQWIAAKNQLESAGAQLTQAAMNAFGQDYQQKLGKEQSDFSREAHQAGHWPEMF
ncbi:hypothetical protein ASPWEDRAFT_61597 [Aspergillus wentii DTO 134E9]|uniref:Uncharacterized protein n=1 Tax=Aspergillus wentii DTO 134E9 TaxID=1073089 RepID=A0A1L9R9Z4_ASPWE|nr:uncharacterized protein ASPWEDRAFT_140589 [Aspergillus wentii DTO 134E9]XP_040685370.1 uncharacterized protein ASPWEDRAFT_61597 [Aspergillus wentii DTO 134E9]KAI9927418.1 hypothetical protein MW887_003031 [Aspergillus wentii]OJJ30788.1 hypothetical protein ASPWEDRAFT_140589 [Aspergillus wentii DTO 134E9]OJJ31693.1 hypothetical protein ASPWEDRAFT_61597 [Aspergillus wentii DTO 134E9]